MDIPPYPQNRELTLADKPLLDELCRQVQPRISELTFAGLYLFRSAHGYRLTLIDDAVVVTGRGYGGGEYFLPPLSGDRLRAALSLLQKGVPLYGADDRFAGELASGGGLEIVEDRDNFDYLYLRDELAELPGNRFHKKKNRINYFTQRHDYGVESYGDAFLKGATKLLDEWYRVRSAVDSSSLLPEVEATREALCLAETLGLAGLVVTIAGDVKAFVLGERLNESTSVCHFEKADPFIDGLTQLIDREFNSRLFPDCRFVNREQDLGNAGLREAKLSYHPHELVKKFRIYVSPRP